MLSLEPIGSNMTLLYTSNATILFSYRTPVAAMMWNDGNRRLIRTETFYSVTTSKHINKWIDGRDCETVPQETIDNLLKS